MATLARGCAVYLRADTRFPRGFRTAAYSKTINHPQGNNMQMMNDKIFFQEAAAAVFFTGR